MRPPSRGAFLPLLPVLILLELTFESTSVMLPNSYPKELHQRVVQTLSRRKGSYHGQMGSWGSWSSWSSCSKSCGTGASTQSRECLLTHKRKRTGRVSSKEAAVGGRCVGRYKRFQLCNTQLCFGNPDFRREQCAAFNKTPFNQRFYSWEPYYDSTDSCSLNCRALGLSFYATLNQTVIDGTPCNAYQSSYEPLDRICVSGRCMHVGCDGVLGSGRIVDTCGKCGGDNSTCKVISGVYSRPHLPFGFNLISTLPPKAENISIYHVTPTSNYLALRDPEGQYVLNGPLGMNSSGRFQAAGSVFSYTRPQTFQGDYLFGEGPLQEPLDVMLFFQTRDPGIRYEYRLPADSPYVPKYPDKIHLSNPLNPAVPGGPAFRSSPPGVVNDAISITANSKSLRKKQNKKDKKDKRRKEKKRKHRKEDILEKKRRKRYMWTDSGYTSCSQTCGGGTQKTRTVCVKRRKKDIEIPPSYCAGLPKPREETVRCNLRPCPAEWSPENWSSCSVTCGIGFQTRSKSCRQKVSPDLTINVPEESCEKAPDVVVAQICNDRECKSLPAWNISEWSSCSSQCGLGTRKRTATCATVEGPVKETLCKEPKPSEEEICDMGSCASDTWFFSNWDTQCLGPCGEGVKRRRVHCSGDALDSQEEPSSCPLNLKPSETKTCEVTSECGGTWFTGPWSECDSHCGPGQQRRPVLCVTWSRSKYKVTRDDSLCKASGERPSDSKSCTSECNANWFTSEWSRCSASCGSGVQRRELKCLDNLQRASLDCSSHSKPDSRQSCNANSCNATQNDYVEVDDDYDYLQKLPNDSSVPPTEVKTPQINGGKKQQSIYKEDQCLDRMKNCNLVYKARLCRLKYYNKLCCKTCQTNE